MHEWNETVFKKTLLTSGYSIGLNDQPHWTCKGGVTDITKFSAATPLNTTQLWILLCRQGLEYTDHFSCKGVRPPPHHKKGCPASDAEALLLNI